MDDVYHNEDKRHFSNDPEEDLRIENEILKLKMMAERGAVFGGTMDELPPMIEAQFLKNVRKFESLYDNANLISIYEYLGKPAYKKADELSHENVNIELQGLLELLQSKNIVLEVLGKYEESIIYRFITEELFFEKIKDVDFFGYICNFIYEEFHPNHKVNIGTTTQEFIDHWFEKKFDEECLEFADHLVTPDGRTFPKQDVINKLRNCLDSYSSFKNIKFKCCETHFEWDEAENKGLGHAEGVFKYDAVIENGESISIEGPFKMYMMNEDGSWRIFYFVFPGFELEW